MHCTLSMRVNDPSHRGPVCHPGNLVNVGAPRDALFQATCCTVKGPDWETIEPSELTRKRERDVSDAVRVKL